MGELKSGASLVRRIVETGERPPTKTVGELMRQIVTEFGQGDRPDLRNAWYDRLRATIEGFGDKPFRIVETARCKARTRKHPSRYFVSVVTRSFEENGWW